MDVGKQFYNICWRWGDVSKQTCYARLSPKPTRCKQLNGLVTAIRAGCRLVVLNDSKSVKERLLGVLYSEYLY
jgi:hypothetical protein